MSEEPGWYPDPYFLGRERYWDGHAWTEECRTAETKEAQPSAKPRPAKNPETATPSATATKAAAKAAATSAAAATAAATSAATRVATTDDAPATGEAPVVREEAPTQKVEPPTPAAAAAPPPPEEPPAATREAPVATKEDAAPATEPVNAELSDADEGDRDEPQDDANDHTAPPSRLRRRFLIGAGAAALLILIVVVVALLTKSGGGGGGASAGSTVGQAASATAGEQYAAVNVDVKVQSGDKSAVSAVSGFSVNGVVDFASSLGSLTLTGPGNAPSEQMVLDDQTIYLNPGALVGRLVKNKAWISATADDLGATATPTGFAVAPTLFEELVGSPTTLLRQLETNGVTATALHSSIYQGTPVEEYSVTLSPQAINARLQGLPSSLRGAVTTGHAPEHVFLTTNGLVRAISVPITVESNGARASGHVVVGFTSWGQVVGIVAPPANQVVSWAQFKAVLNFTSKLG